MSWKILCSKNRWFQMLVAMATVDWVVARDLEAQCPPSENPSSVGCWEAVPPCDPSNNEYDCASHNWLGWPSRMHAIHMALTHHNGGTIVIWNGTYLPHTVVWQIDNMLGIRDQTAPATDLWCSGHSILPDGRVLALGGGSTHCPDGNSVHGEKKAYIMDPALTPKNWAQVSNEMTLGRWYPSTTVLPTGRVLIASGGDCPTQNTAVLQDPPEVFDPATGTFTSLGSVASSGRYEGPYFPNMYALKDGKVLHSGPFLSESQGPNIENATNNGGGWAAVV